MSFMDVFGQHSQNTDRLRVGQYLLAILRAKNDRLVFLPIRVWKFTFLSTGISKKEWKH